MTTNPRRTVLLLAVLAVIAAGCSGETTETTTSETPTSETSGATTTEAPEPADEGVTVRAAITGDEDTITPYTYVSGFPGWNLLMLQYDSLLQYDAEGQPQPWLAESVEVNDDLTEYTITLVDGVTWHDGEPLTIDDVEFTFNYFIENAAGRFARDLGAVESVSTDGNLTMTVTLSEPSPSFDLVALADIPIIPQHVWESVEEPGDHVFESVSMWVRGPTSWWSTTRGKATGSRPTPTTSEVLRLSMSWSS